MLTFKTFSFSKINVFGMKVMSLTSNSCKKHSKPSALCALRCKNLYKF